MFENTTFLEGMNLLNNTLKEINTTLQYTKERIVDLEKIAIEIKELMKQNH